LIECFFRGVPDHIWKMRKSNREAGVDYRIVRFRNANVAHNAAFGLIHGHLAAKENEDVPVIKHLLIVEQEG